MKNKQVLVAAGVAVGVMFLLNNWAPTRKLFGGEVSMQEAVTASFWSGRR